MQRKYRQHITDEYCGLDCKTKKKQTLNVGSKDYGQDYKYVKTADELTMTKLVK